MVETTASEPIATVAFIGKTGAGKSTLINALSRDDEGNYIELASVAGETQVESHTSQVTVYENINWFDHNGKVNFVDVPGLDDSKGTDQENADMTVDELKKIEKLSLMVFVLSANEKFGGGMQTAIKTYVNMLLTSKESNIWNNVAVVITKHAYQNRHKTVDNWKNIGEQLKSNFLEAIQKQCPGANPQFFCICYPDPEWGSKETDGQSPQFHYTLDNMKELKAKAIDLARNNSMDLSNLRFIMVKETYTKWVNSKNETLLQFQSTLYQILSYESIKEMIIKSLDQVSNDLKGFFITSKEDYQNQLQENIDTHFKGQLVDKIDPEIQKCVNKLQTNFDKYIVSTKSASSMQDQDFFKTGKDHKEQFSNAQKGTNALGAVGGGVGGFLLAGAEVSALAAGAAAAIGVVAVGAVLYTVFNTWNNVYASSLDKQKCREEFVDQFASQFQKNHSQNMIMTTKERIKDAVDSMEQSYSQNLLKLDNQQNYSHLQIDEKSEK